MTLWENLKRCKEYGTERRRRQDTALSDSLYSRWSIDGESVKMHHFQCLLNLALLMDSKQIMDPAQVKPSHCMVKSAY